MLVVCVPYLRNKFNVYIDQLERKHTLHFKEVICNIIMIRICIVMGFISLEKINSV